MTTSPSEKIPASPDASLGTPPSTAPTSVPEVFQLGDSVIYGLSGRCKVAGVRTRDGAPGQLSQSFFLLEPERLPQNRSQKKDPQIWVPMAQAHEMGLRHPSGAAAAQAVLEAIIDSDEFYFPLNVQWSASVQAMEKAIRLEGLRGLAKAYSFLFIAHKRAIVFNSAENRWNENVSRLFLRELSEALGRPTRELEAELAKRMRKKLRPAN